MASAFAERDKALVEVWTIFLLKILVCSTLGIIYEPMILFILLDYREFSSLAKCWQKHARPKF